MKTVLRVSLATIFCVVLWSVLIFIGTSEGWWKRTLAPRGDVAAFMKAAAAVVDSANKGNAVLAIIDHDTILGVHARSVGDVVDSNTVFQVASLSKWITAWGVMALVQDGKVNLDAPVSQYLKRWALPASTFDNNKVTVRRLLSHTAGLTDGLGYAGFAPGAAIPTIDETLKHPDADADISGVIKVGVEPGSEWIYSGGGYAILQLIIEDVSGETFEAYMQRAVFQPLGMTRSTFNWQADSGSTFATFYDRNSKPTPHMRYSAVSAVSLYTTVSDLARFLRANSQANASKASVSGTLTTATLNEMWKPHAQKFSEDIWGLGTTLYARNSEDGFIVGHDGNRGDPPVNTTARINPHNGNGIIILETGTPLLATRLAGDWVFWETGNVDFLVFTMALSGMLRLMAIGSIAIVLGVPMIAWWRRRQRLS